MPRSRRWRQRSSPRSASAPAACCAADPRASSIAVAHDAGLRFKSPPLGGPRTLWLRLGFAGGCLGLDRLLLTADPAQDRIGRALARFPGAADPAPEGLRAPPP